MPEAFVGRVWGAAAPTAQATAQTCALLKLRCQGPAARRCVPRVRGEVPRLPHSRSARPAGA
eukprot:3978904-Alexandrium_andersonii.AAC.1